MVRSAWLSPRIRLVWEVGRRDAAGSNDLGQVSRCQRGFQFILVKRLSLRDLRAGSGGAVQKSYRYRPIIPIRIGPTYLIV